MECKTALIFMYKPICDLKLDQIEEQDDVMEIRHKRDSHTEGQGFILGVGKF